MSTSSEFAKRQLERMGWTEGSGLGKERQGRATPILVQKRADETGGLGIEKEKARVIKQTVQSEWWKDNLGDTLAKLSHSKKKKKKRKLDEGEPSRATKITYTDEELFIATGGARFGMRAGITRNQAKWRRTEEQENRSSQQKEKPVVSIMESTTTISRITVLQSTKQDAIQRVNNSDPNPDVPLNDADAVPSSKKKKRKAKKSSDVPSTDCPKTAEEATERPSKKKTKKLKKAR